MISDTPPVRNSNRTKAPFSVASPVLRTPAPPLSFAIRPLSPLIHISPFQAVAPSFFSLALLWPCICPYSYLRLSQTHRACWSLLTLAWDKRLGGSPPFPLRLATSCSQRHCANLLVNMGS